MKLVRLTADGVAIMIYQIVEVLSNTPFSVPKLAGCIGAPLRYIIHLVYRRLQTLLGCRVNHGTF